MPGDTGWPRTWVGTWIAPDSKTVRIRRSRHGVTVTVAPGPGQPPYLSAPLLDGTTKPIERLPARCGIGAQGRRYLEIEAGTVHLGPLYRLHAVVEEAGGWVPAADSTAPTDVVLRPETSIGLYDDYEDDLGAGWAYPLRPLRHARRRWRPEIRWRCRHP